MKKCLSCYKKLSVDEKDFHPACSRKIFGSSQPPLIDFKKDKLADIAQQIINRKTAVPGVQSKLSLQLKKQRNEFPHLTIVGTKGDYILKPPSKEFTQLPENEDLTMHLAEIAKIKVSNHTLIRLKSGELCYLTKRFDRRNSEKLAVEDCCQLSENLTAHKYRGSIEKVGKLIERYTTNKGFELQRLFEVVLFSFLTGNADMHLKNFSILEGALAEYTLAPAYDLINTKIVIPTDKEESALTINGKKNRLTLHDFDTLASSFGITEKPLHAIYNRFKEAQPLWLQFTQQSFLSSEMKEKYNAIIHERFERLF